MAVRMQKLSELNWELPWSVIKRMCVTLSLSVLVAEWA